MTKRNAVAMNDMELDMVAGGGFIDMFIPSRSVKIKKEDSAFSQALTAAGIIAMAIVVFGKILTRGC